MGDDNEPTEASPVDTAASVAPPAPGHSHSPTATFTTTSTTTSIPSMTSSEAASTTTLLISIPAIKLLKKRVRVNTAKKDLIATSAGSKPPAKKTRRKKAAEGEDPSKKP